MKNFLKPILEKFITITGGNMEISKTREISTPPIREIPTLKKPVVESLSCPYCLGKNFVRRGTRCKKLEIVQLYLCKNCHKTFTPQRVKGKHYPLSTIFDAISLYNLGYSLEESCRRVNMSQRDGLQKNGSNAGMGASTLSNWLTEFKMVTPFERMREFAIKKYSPKDMVITATLAHRQLYRYRFHRAKCGLMIEQEFRHRKFLSLQEFLEMVPAECPHQYFQEGLRASESPLTFSKQAMIVRGKTNYATKIAFSVLQSVKERVRRHEALQKFMLYNDSVTVATEVPVYITRDDLEHMQTQLGFEMYVNGDMLSKDKSNACSGLPKLITGHIDILQIRNGQIHILDYKPRAEKERPVEQLTLYAMALSRLTGLRMYEFKCAWFDEKDYFEFYPLHVLHKPKKARRRRKVETMEGTYFINKEANKIKSIRPIQ